MDLHLGLQPSLYCDRYTPCNRGAPARLRSSSTTPKKPLRRISDPPPFHRCSTLYKFCKCGYHKLVVILKKIFRGEKAFETTSNENSHLYRESPNTEVFYIISLDGESPNTEVKTIYIPNRARNYTFSPNWDGESSFEETDTDFSSNSDKESSFDLTMDDIIPMCDGEFPKRRHPFRKSPIEKNSQRTQETMIETRVVNADCSGLKHGGAADSAGNVFSFECLSGQGSTVSVGQIHAPFYRLSPEVIVVGVDECKMLTFKISAVCGIVLCLGIVVQLIYLLSL